MLSSLPSRIKIAQSDPVDVVEKTGFSFGINPMSHRNAAYQITMVSSRLLPTDERVEDIQSVRTEMCVPAIASPEALRNFYDKKSITGGDGEDEPQLSRCG